MDVVNFKSIPTFFEKEGEGIKNNTVRKFTDIKDERKNLLDKFEKGDIFDLGIKIINTQNKSYFIREIRDVSIYEDLYIITWYEE